MSPRFVMEISIEYELGITISTLILNKETTKGQRILVRFDSVMGCVEPDQYHKRDKMDDIEIPNNSSMEPTYRVGGAWQNLSRLECFIDRICHHKCLEGS